VRNGKVVIGGTVRKKLSAAGFRVVNPCYVKDDQHVFYVFWPTKELPATPRLSLLTEADPETFAPVMPGVCGWARDKSHVYYGEKIVPVEPAAFELLGYGYGKDAVTVVRGAEKVALDARTVRIGAFYQWDATRACAFVMDPAAVKGADGGTFEVIHDGVIEPFAKDARHVFYQTQEIKGADSKTFRWLGDGYGRDERTIFFRDGRAESTDLEHFQPLKWGYARDAAHFYFEGKRFAVADPKTFRVLGMRDYVDKLGSAGYVAEDSVHFYYDGKAYAKKSWWQFWK